MEPTNMNNSMEYSVAEQSENAFFVQILSNYPNMFQRPKSKIEREGQEYARNAITMRFNEKFNKHLSIKQISRKINNLKARMKEKNTRSLTGTKNVKYHDWEILFLNLWTGYGASHSKKKYNKTENTETRLHSEDSNNSLEVSYNTNAKSPISIIEPSDIEIKIEPDFRLSKDEDDIESVSDISATPHWQIKNDETEPQSEGKFNSIKNEDEQFDKMTFEELKRNLLISQVKMLKAQEDAARAKEKLNLYKLKILKRKNENIDCNGSATSRERVSK